MFQSRNIATDKLPSPVTSCKSGAMDPNQFFQCIISVEDSAAYIRSSHVVLKPRFLIIFSCRVQRLRKVFEFLLALHVWMS